MITIIADGALVTTVGDVTQIAHLDGGVVGHRQSPLKQNQHPTNTLPPPSFFSSPFFLFFASCHFRARVDRLRQVWATFNKIDSRVRKSAGLDSFWTRTRGLSWTRGLDFEP